MDIFRLLLILMACVTLMFGCVEKKKEPIQIPWWKPLKPDVVIGQHEFYAGTCSITQVTNTGNIKTEKIIFEAPYSSFATCSNRGPLQYDGEYIILDVCIMSFGAGGCGGGRYRSADFEQWEEHIGVTWINSEEYEAWRKVGSTSSKADSVKRVVKE